MKCNMKRTVDMPDGSKEKINTFEIADVFVGNDCDAFVNRKPGFLKPLDYFGLKVSSDRDVVSKYFGLPVGGAVFVISRS